MIGWTAHTKHHGCISDCFITSQDVCRTVGHRSLSSVNYINLLYRVPISINKAKVKQVVCHSHYLHSFISRSSCTVTAVLVLHYESDIFNFRNSYLTVYWSAKVLLHQHWFTQLQTSNFAERVNREETGSSSWAELLHQLIKHSGKNVSLVLVCPFMICFRKTEEITTFKVKEKKILWELM